MFRSAAWCRLVTAALFLAVTGFVRPLTGAPVGTESLRGKSTILEADSGQTFRYKVGDKFRLKLASNITTGYSWQPDPVAGDPCVIAGQSTYAENPHLPGMVGVGGTEYFPFEVARRGTETIRLTYRQPWKRGGVGQHVEFTVVVR